jgi:hypothetical protein
MPIQGQMWSYVLRASPTLLRRRGGVSSVDFSCLYPSSLIDIASSIHKHDICISIVFSLTPLHQILHHGLDPVQHIVPTNMSRSRPCVQHTHIEVAITAILNARLRIDNVRSRPLLWHGSVLGVFGWYDTISFEIVDLLGQLLAYLVDGGAHVQGHDPESFLSGFWRVGLVCGSWGLDWVVGELADGGREVGEEFWKLLVYAAESINVGRGDLVVCLRFLLWFWRGLRAWLVWCVLLLGLGRHGGR